MIHNIQPILEELYLIDPGFRQHEKELKVLIQKLHTSNPQVEMNAVFSGELRQQLVRQAKVLMASKKEVSTESGFTLFMRRLLFPFATGVLATVLVIVLVPPKNLTPESAKQTFEPSTISQIDERVREVDSHLTTCVKTEIPLTGQSTQGGMVTFYNKPAGLQKMKEELLGETGKVINKYYFAQNELVYVVHEVTQYNRPVYWDEKFAEQKGDAEFFDPKKSLVTQSIYYFEKGHLVRFVDEKGHVFNLKDDLSRTLQGEYLWNRKTELRWLFEAKKES